MTEHRITCDMCGVELDRHRDRYVLRFQSVPVYRAAGSKSSYDLCLTCAARLKVELSGVRKPSVT